MIPDFLAVFGAFAICVFCNYRSSNFQIAFIEFALVGTFLLLRYRQYRFFFRLFDKRIRFRGGLLFEKAQKRIWRRYTASLAPVAFLLSLVWLESSLTLESPSGTEFTFVWYLFSKINAFTNNLIFMAKSKLWQIPMKIMVGPSSSSTSVCDNKHDIQHVWKQ